MENNQQEPHVSEDAVVTEAVVTEKRQEAKRDEQIDSPLFKEGLLKKVGFWFLNTAVVASISAFAGYYAAMLTPVPVQFMVFDLDKAMSFAAKAASEKGMDPRAAADEVVSKAKAKVRQAAEMGIVVLDRNAVIDAPAGALISFDERDLSFPKHGSVMDGASGGGVAANSPAPSGPAPNATQEQLQAQLKAVNDQLKAIQQQAIGQQNAGSR